jgi:hypothetical protein
MRGPPIWIVAGLLTAGCAQSAPPIDRALQDRAVRAITDTFGTPLTVHLQEAWLGQYGETMRLVCGRIDAPLALGAGRSGLRFVYEDHSRHGQVEFHELVVADTIGGTALLHQNRLLFDRLWETSCAPTDPSRPWLDRLFG